MRGRTAWRCDSAAFSDPQSSPRSALKPRHRPAQAPNSSSTISSSTPASAGEALDLRARRVRHPVRHRNLVARVRHQMHEPRLDLRPGPTGASIHPPRLVAAPVRIAVRRDPCAARPPTGRVTRHRLPVVPQSLPPRKRGCSPKSGSASRNCSPMRRIIASNTPARASSSTNRRTNREKFQWLGTESRHAADTLTTRDTPSTRSTRRRARPCRGSASNPHTASNAGLRPDSRTNEAVERRPNTAPATTARHIARTG